MATLTAYLDESADNKVFAVSGFVTRNEVWESFSPEWQTELNTPPKISHFKMHDVFTSKTNGVFKNHPIQKRIAKTESLISVINKHLPTKNDLAVNVVMDFSAYKSTLEPVLAKAYKNPYLWCFQGILASCASWISANVPNETVDFVFDNNKKGFCRALLLYRRVANLPGFVEFRNLVGTVEPGNDKMLMPLQAADLLAGQTRLYGTDPSSATFMSSIAQTTRSHFSYLLGKNRQAAIRSQIQTTREWLQQFSNS